jgi:lipopolysaccharide/colanic/teichoic acid biosynthesis glycosyltransferase
MAMDGVEITLDAVVRVHRPRKVAPTIPRGLRLLDLAMVALALPFALALGLVIAVAVFLDSPGPVLFRSQRVGRGGRVFEMLKFRTMLRDAAGPLISSADDVRYTPLGRRLAPSRLDELPQIWNVIKGDMRLVGPRPELPEFVAEFPDEYEQILSVPPGLTGPAQVAYAWEGKVLALAQAVDRARVYRESILPYKLAIDLAYVKRHSVLGDVGVLLRTAILPIRQVINRLGADLARERSTVAARLMPAFGLGSVVIALAAMYALEVSASF